VNPKGIISIGMISLGIIFLVVYGIFLINSDGSRWYSYNAWIFAYGFGLSGIILIISGIVLRKRNRL